MKREDTPATTTPARTVYRLTDAEVARALADFVENSGEAIPPGRQGVWVRDAHHRDDWLATLVVDHGVSDAHTEGPR